MKQAVTDLTQLVVNQIYFSEKIVGDDFRNVKYSVKSCAFYLLMPGPF